MPERSRLALITVLLLVKCSPKYAVIDGTRLMDNVGTIGILPQLLSALGALFTAAGVGTVIASGVSACGGNAGMVDYAVGGMVDTYNVNTVDGAASAGPVPLTLGPRWGRRTTKNDP